MKDNALTFPQIGKLKHSAKICGKFTLALESLVNGYSIAKCWIKFDIKHGTKVIEER